MFEGSRAFDVAWGTATFAVCLVLAVTLLFWWLPRPATSFFGERLDPKRHLQLAYGLFAMGMAFTNLGCRYIPHNYLEGVHEGFFALTVVLVVMLLPRASGLWLARLRARFGAKPRGERSAA
jgi:Na+-driven multidrug efflux pump